MAGAQHCEISRNYTTERGESFLTEGTWEEAKRELGPQKIDTVKEDE